VTKLNDTAAEQAKNAEVIAALAQETRRPLDEVREVYEGELARLKTDARITDYVALFASRSAKARLVRGDRSTKDEISS
jgi:predicted extracellular nuclease